LDNLGRFLDAWIVRLFTGERDRSSGNFAIGWLLPSKKWRAAALHPKPSFVLGAFSTKPIVVDVTDTDPHK